MELHIEPDPTPEERAAIEQALAAATAGRTERARGAWWQAGVEEALSGEPGGRRSTLPRSAAGRDPGA